MISTSALPKEKIVAVRFAHQDDDYNWNTDGFNDFLQSAVGLTGQQIDAPPVQ